MWMDVGNEGFGLSVVGILVMSGEGYRGFGREGYDDGENSVDLVQCV